MEADWPGSNHVGLEQRLRTAHTFASGKRRSRYEYHGVLILRALALLMLYSAYVALGRNGCAADSNGH